MEDLDNLVKQAKNGDKEAFGKIYDAFAQRVFRYISIKIQNNHDAEDLLQEVFIKVWKALPKYTNDNFSAWIYKIASNSVNDFFRRKYRRPETLELTETIELVSSENAEEELDKDIAMQVLGSALLELQSDHREIIELRFIQDFSVEETSNILNKNSVALRVAQHRAIKNLKKIVNSKGRSK